MSWVQECLDHMTFAQRTAHAVQYVVCAQISPLLCRSKTAAGSRTTGRVRNSTQHGPNRWAGQHGTVEPGLRLHGSLLHPLSALHSRPAPGLTGLARLDGPLVTGQCSTRPTALHTALLGCCGLRLVGWDKHAPHRLAVLWDAWTDVTARLALPCRSRSSVHPSRCVLRTRRLRPRRCSRNLLLCMLPERGTGPLAKPTVLASV